MPLECCNKTINGSLTKQAIEDNFDDLHLPLTLLQAKTEADCCLYCFDAPCINACPTNIDIPTFIHQIKTENLIGSAKTILTQNIMGGTCARACPTEVLCEQACVLNQSHQQPVKIGSLQRFAVDYLLENTTTHPFQRAPLTGQQIAVIGAGPAGLSCAHRLAMLGHDVTVFEGRNKPGGLNEFGLAAYKMADDFAQQEIEFLLQIGGINIEYGKRLNHNILLHQLQQNFDAVFIGVGLGATHALGIAGENDPCVIDANLFIEQLRQAKDKSTISAANDVIVIGAGNTAIDAAIQSKRLGAKNVTLVYRRGEEQMSATRFEIDLARQNGVHFKFWSAPLQLIRDGDISSMEFAITKMENDKVITTEQRYLLAADSVLKAIGQHLETDNYPTLDIQQGKIVVNTEYQTSLNGVFAGGDCIDSGEDLTVQAVEDGKQAAYGIHRYLIQNNQNENNSQPQNPSTSLAGEV